MREIRAREICLIVLCFLGHAHFAVSDLHGRYFADDYSGIWTKFDGIGAISGGGVCAVVLIYLLLFLVLFFTRLLEYWSRKFIAPMSLSCVTVIICLQILSVFFDIQFSQLFHLYFLLYWYDSKFFGACYVELLVLYRSLYRSQLVLFPVSLCLHFLFSSIFEWVQVHISHS